MNFPPLIFAARSSGLVQCSALALACFKYSSFIQETIMEELLCARPYTRPLDTETKKAQHLLSKTW